MKLTLTLTALVAFSATSAALAGPNATQQISALPNGPVKSALVELNAEDQRLTDGTYNAETGTLTLYTQDMKAGADGNISRRPVVIEGIRALDGTNGADGRDGEDYDPAALSSVTALGSLQMMDPMAGETTWAFGFGGQVEGDAGIAAGIRYGFTDDLSAYATVGSSLEGKGVSYGLGMSGRF